MPDQPESVVVGIDWHEGFDEPVERRGADGKPEYWLADDAPTRTRVRGGHCVCIPFDPAADHREAWSLCDQKREGKCVGWGWSRRQILANKRLYNGDALFDYAVKHDGIDSTNDGSDGTTVRAGGDTLVDVGAWRMRRSGAAGNAPILADGIARFLWCRDIEQVLAALANPVYRERGAAPFLNSWGRGYPRVTWASLELWDTMLFARRGEAAIGVDRPGRG